MKNLFLFLFFGYWIFSILSGIKSYLFPPKEYPVPPIYSPYATEQANQIPDPKPPESGHYKAHIIGDRGDRLIGLDIYLPASPILNKIAAGTKNFGGISLQPPVAGLGAIVNQGKEIFFPIECHAWLVQERGKTIYFGIDFGEGSRWIAKQSKGIYSGELEGGRRLVINYLGSYDSDVINARASESVQNLEGQYANRNGAESTQTSSSRSWFENAVSVTGDFLSDPAVQDFLVQALRYALDERSTENSATNSRSEPVNPRTHSVQRQDGSTYIRTNPDGNPYNNFTPP